MADDNLSVYVNIGFEDGMAHEKPFPGEYELRLNRTMRRLQILLVTMVNIGLLKQRRHSQAEI